MEQAMSQENVEIVRGLVFAPDVDIAPLFRDEATWAALACALASVIHADFHCTGTLLGSQTFYGVGAEGIRAFYLDWMAPWMTYRVEIEETRDLGDRVLVLANDFGRHQGNTEEVRGSNASVWTFRDGAIVRFDAYADRAEALKAVGLAE
jgi:ketosteroid isomerase-like protein